MFLEPCDKKTTYDTHNITTVINVTTLENRSVLENVRPRRGTPTRLPTPSTRRQRISTRISRQWRAPTQVTVTETIIELENVTSTQNVSVLINETVRYNATYNVTYVVLRNVTYDVTFNETYNARFRRGEWPDAVDARRRHPTQVTYNATVNVTEYVNATVNVTTTYNISSHQPVDVVLALDASRSVSDADFVAENRAGGLAATPRQNYQHKPKKPR